jgi:hypothetical protein
MDIPVNRAQVKSREIFEDPIGVPADEFKIDETNINDGKVFVSFDKNVLSKHGAMQKAVLMHPS